jgi:hypothetical protein
MMVEEQHRVDAETARRLRMSESTVLSAGTAAMAMQSSYHGGRWQERRELHAQGHHRDVEQMHLRNAALEVLNEMGHPQHGNSHQQQGWGEGYGHHNQAAGDFQDEYIERSEHRLQEEQQQFDSHESGNDDDIGHSGHGDGHECSTLFHFPRYDVSPPSTASGAVRYDGISDGDDDVDGTALQGTRACVDTNAYFYPRNGSDSSSGSGASSSSENNPSDIPREAPVSVVEVAMPRHPSSTSPLHGGDLHSNPPESFSSAMSSSTERTQYEEMLAAQKRAAVLDAASSQPWTAPPSRRGPSAMAAISPLSPPPPVRISQELGAAGSSPPHPVAYEEDPRRYEFDPVVGCYFDRVANRFVKPSSSSAKHRGGGPAVPQQQQQHVPFSQSAAERGASPGQRVPPKRPTPNE